MNSITNYNIGQYEINQCTTGQKIRRTDETGRSSTLSLDGLRHDNFFLEMFSYLNMAMLGRSCRINKRWNQLISQSNLLWRSAIYRERAFGNDKWIQYFGNEVIAKEEPNEEFYSLPVKDFIADCRKVNEIFPKKAVNLMLVRLPKILNEGLNLESLEKLINNYFSNAGIKHTVELPKIKQESVEQTCWVSITNVLPESRNKTYLQQRKMFIKIGYDFPRILEYITCSIAKLFDSRVCLPDCSPTTYIRCKENFEGTFGAVGDLNKGKILDLRYRSEQIAAVAFRRF